MHAIKQNCTHHHDQERQLHAQGGRRIGWACDVCRGDIGGRQLQHRGLNVFVRDSRDVSIGHRLVPQLQRLAANGVENTEKAALEGVTITNPSNNDPIVMLKHFGPNNPDLVL